MLLFEVMDLPQVACFTFQRHTILLGALQEKTPVLATEKRKAPVSKGIDWFMVASGHWVS